MLVPNNAMRLNSADISFENYFDYTWPTYYSFYRPLDLVGL